MALATRKSKSPEIKLTSQPIPQKQLILAPKTPPTHSKIMSEYHKRQLQQQLWNIADTLRGKMNADEFRDYILGFIFYKYLSERMTQYANKELAEDQMAYDDLDENKDQGSLFIEAIKSSALEQLGYFLKPSDLFHRIASKGSSGEETANLAMEDQATYGKTTTKNNFILGDLARILKNIEASTMGTESEDDFDKLFEDLDLSSSKLGKSEQDKNELIAKVLVHLDKIDFELENAEIDVLGDAYEYLIGQFASGAGKKAGEFYTPQEVSTVLA
jgi:type I restriction enzyme M protein